MTRKPGLWVVAILVLQIAALSTARAEKASARAKVEYTEGLKLYNLGEYEPALTHFKQAYLELPDPALLFNIGQCQRQMSQFGAAAKSYRAFLRESKDLSQRQRDEVQRLLSEMEQAVRDQRMAAPPTGMQPPHDETTTTHAAETTTPPPATTPPPTTTAPSTTTTIVATPPPPPPRRPWYKNGLGMGLAGGGVALVIIGGGLLGYAGSEDSASRTAMSLDEAKNDHNSAVTFQSAGLALIGVGAAATVGGVIVIALGARKHREVAP